MHDNIQALDHLESITKVLTEEVETHRPAILLADEPIGNLDSQNGDAAMQLLPEIHREGAVTCIVAHEERFADHAGRSVYLFDGPVVESAAGQNAN